ncbi:MAG: hypothetical protein ACD_39C00745G0002 [uncultured bacterium]|nr:MAG: hypothetical protein ACD_39C00745G0002 [uncultured bacterium]
MQPQAILNLPEAIRNDISIYLAPGEKVLKAIKSSAERTASKGQVWLVLSSGSVLFHTCETGKEPLIALLSRREIREIEYFQRASEVVLTFVPARNPQNVTRLSFSNAQRPELEDFCDDLADLINFKKETVAGVKTYSATSTVEMPRPAAEAVEPPPSAMRSAASAVKHSARPEAENRSKVEPVTPVAVPEVKPEVKISTPSVTADVKGSELPSDKGSPAPRPLSYQVSEKGAAISGAGLRVSYIIAATFISVLVGFLWYKFFSALSGMNSRS